MLDESFYEQVADEAVADKAIADETAADEAVAAEGPAARSAVLRRSMMVVLLSALAAGLGMWGRLGPVRMVWFALIELGGWFVWAVLMFWIGTKLLPRPGMSKDIGVFLGVVGFSSAPGLLRILGLIPRIDVLFFFAALVWMLMAAVAAVKAVFRYTGVWQAVAVVVIAWVIVRIAQRLLFAVI